MSAKIVITCRQGMYQPVEDFQQVTHQTLPPGIYTLNYDDSDKFFLSRGVDFVLPEKRYGNLDNIADRIISTYGSRSGNNRLLLKRRQMQAYRIDV